MVGLKRTLDLAGALGGLALLWPLGLLIAWRIKREDGGPVFFRQERIGRHGEPFRIWKFRTMVVDAPQRGPALTVGPDPRITRTGRFLREYKLDELPQLLNVLAGEMSLVGPRPEVARYVALYSAEQRRVLDFVPGLTDPASIRFRHESELLASAPDPERLYVESLMPEKLGLNLAYGAQATVWSDMAVLWHTALRILRPVALPAASRQGA